MMRLKGFKYKLSLSLRFIRSVLQRSATVISFLTSLCVLCLLVYQFGFQESAEVHRRIEAAYQFFLQLFLYTGLVRIGLNPKGFRQEKGFWIEVILLFTLLCVVMINTLPPGEVHPATEKINLITGYTLLVFISVVQFSKQIVTTLQRHLKPELMFAYSFLFIILAGTFLLMLPNAHRGHLGFTDALFTATSAVCVTGLTVVETASTFTHTGQIILIALIQIGGIGVMTFTSFFAMSFFSRVAFQDQMALKGILNEDSLNDIFRTLLYILLTAFIIEFVGAYVIYMQVSDITSEVIPNKLFFACFHSISSFCNAGFSTLPDNLYDPAVRHLYGFQSWIAFMIILGGIGFPILFNYGRLLNVLIRDKVNQLRGRAIPSEHRAHIVSTTTRIVIPITLVLIIGGTLLFWLFENNNSLRGLSFTGKLATSFMSAVTPRTAGFNNVEMGKLLSPTIFLTIILMWIGASPMSTGGGIKTTTFVVALRNIYSSIKGKERTEIAKRQLTVGNINRANAVIFLSLLWIGGASITLTVLEPQASITQVIFEVISALSTVGLTLDLTPHLSDAGKMVISLTMFVGRVGLITLLSGIVKQQTSQIYTYPDDTVII